MTSIDFSVKMESACVIDSYGEIVVSWSNINGMYTTDLFTKMIEFKSTAAWYELGMPYTVGISGYDIEFRDYVEELKRFMENSLNASQA